MRVPLSMVCAVWLIACAIRGDTTVEHRVIPKKHAIEYFSISRINVSYPAYLTSQQRDIVAKYRPAEAVAEKIRAWAEETGMWGGAQDLILELHSLSFVGGRVLDPGEAQPSVLENETRLGVHVEIHEAERALHRMDVTRTIGGSRAFDTHATNQSIGEIFSSKHAMAGLVADVAWQIVYQMTPPGYDEAIIRAGYRDGVRTATTIAAGRGFLTWWEFYRAAWAVKLDLSDEYREDFSCGAVLSKPRWMPSIIWNFPAAYKNYSRCKARAAEAARRRLSVGPENAEDRTSAPDKADSH